MEQDRGDPAAADPRLDEAWRVDRPHLLALATRMVRNRSDAEDLVQEAFGRLARRDISAIEDRRGWLTVVVRRLCLDHLRAAPTRRELVPGEAVDGDAPMFAQRGRDPADRVTLDDEVQLALALVLDRLSPAERTAFVLHDVFGVPFEAIAALVGRTPAACRQLASRARRSIRNAPSAAPDGAGVAPRPEHRQVAERFIAACAGGDLDGLVVLLDPGVHGDATLLAAGPLAHLEGADAVARQAIALFGPATHRSLLPVPLEDGTGIVVVERGGAALAVVRLEVEGGRVRLLQAIVLPPQVDGEA